MKTPAFSLLQLASAILACCLSGNIINAQSDDVSRPRSRRPEAAWVTPSVTAPRVHRDVFTSKAAGENVSCLIYLPPDYEKATESRYPVTYWLHGIGGSQQGVPGFCARLTQAIEAGKTPPMIVVFVNGMVDSFYCDAANQPRPVETVLVEDLIPHIDATYRTIPKRNGRAIEGFSMGGFGAGHVGFKYPGLFGAVSLIDAALVDLDTMKRRHSGIFDRVFAGEDERFTDAHPVTLLQKNRAQIKDGMIIRQIVGPLLAPNRSLHERLTALGIEHEFRVIEGAPHNHAFIYDHLGDDNWPFYQKAFAPPAPESVTSAQ
jgi:endo-1,4-beta-xylanase